MYVLKAGQVVDGTGKEPLSGAVVVVDGQRIVHVGAPEEFGSGGLDGALADAEVLDFGIGKTLMPGMIDSHLHTSFNGEPDYWDIVFKQTESFRTLTSLKNVQADLRAGFTTVRVLGEKSHLDIALRKAIEAGIVTGPRLVCAGQNITVTGGHADIWLTPDIRFEQGLGGVIVDGPEEVRKAARQQLKAGADLVKLLVTGGVMSEGSEPGLQHMSEEEIAAAVNEAHRVGKRVAVHAQGTKGIQTSVRLGVDTVEHGYYLDREGADLMAKRGAYLIPTLTARDASAVHDDKVPAYVLRKSKEAGEAVHRAFQYAREAGVRIAAGTDAGSPHNYHGRNARELELLVEFGMSPMEAVVAATKTAAECLAIGDKVGTLEQGKGADIICVDGDPLTDISACRKVGFVMKEGAVVVKDGSPLFRA